MSKWTDAQRIDASIRRAARRGRVAREYVLRLSQCWVIHMARRARSAKYHCWGADMLNRAAAARRSGNKILARQLLADAHFAITMSIKT